MFSTKMSPGQRRVPAGRHQLAHPVADTGQQPYLCPVSTFGSATRRALLGTGQNEPRQAVAYKLSSAFLYAICSMSAPNSTVSTEAIHRVARGATTRPAAKAAAIHRPRQ
jgi:hypothetical protein